MNSLENVTRISEHVCVRISFSNNKDNSSVIVCVCESSNMRSMSVPWHSIDLNASHEMDAYAFRFRTN